MCKKFCTFVALNSNLMPKQNTALLLNLPKLAEIDMLHYIEQRSGELYSWHGEGLTGDENLRHVRFTPNFFESEIEYIVMDNIRDDDFNWRK